VSAAGRGSTLAAAPPQPEMTTSLIDAHSAPVVVRDRQRARVPLHPIVEAACRVAFAYIRDQHGLRRRRPLGRYLARNAKFLAAARRETTLEAEMSGLSVLLSTSDWTLARSVYAAGVWDPLLVGTAFDALRVFGRNVGGTTFLEIGANFGVYSLPAVAELGFARAVGYEPDPASYELFQRNIARNGLDSRVDAVQAALSDRSGELSLSLSATNAGDNRIVGGGEGASASGRHVVTVRAATFDEEVAAGRIPLSDLGLVWLDVQGHEAGVLAGARRLLATDIPVVLEYSSDMLGRSRQALDELIATNYDVLVDLGWSALTDRIRFQPADAVRDLAPGGRGIETDLLLLKRN
jgi:FkbM family methyltransferase